MDQPDTPKGIEALMSALQALQAEVAELKARVIRLEGGQTPNETRLSDTHVREFVGRLIPKSSPVLGVDPSSYPNLTDACDNLTAKIVDIWNKRLGGGEYWAKDELAALTAAGLTLTTIQTPTERVLLRYPDSFQKPGEVIGLLLPLLGNNAEWREWYDCGYRASESHTLVKIKSACVVRIDEGNSYTLIKKGQGL